MAAKETCHSKSIRGQVRFVGTAECHGQTCLPCRIVYGVMEHAHDPPRRMGMAAASLILSEKFTISDRSGSR